MIFDPNSPPPVPDLALAMASLIRNEETRPDIETIIIPMPDLDWPLVGAVVGVLLLVLATMLLIVAFRQQQ